MATVILVRHGRTTANASGILAGRTPGVRLDETGITQAQRVGDRIAGVPVVGVVSSPQERCRQTAQAIAAAHPERLRVRSEKGIAECDYGEWQGRKLKDLAKQDLWRTVQHHPSAAAFPGGESMVAMQHRAVAAVRRRDAEVTAEHGLGAVWVAVSHGDLIKAILADALGMHLDLFQRLHVDPASISVIDYTPDRPYVLVTNSHAGDLDWLAARARQARPERGAVGGGAARRGRGRHDRSAAPSVVARDRLLPAPRVGSMSPIVHGFDPPDRFVAGTVGEPGARTFFLQAREGERVVSVALEKQQVEALAERIDELLDEVMGSSETDAVVPAVAPRDLADEQPLETPIEEEFRAGTMTLSWDPRDERVVVEVFPVGEESVGLGEAANEGDEVVLEEEDEAAEVLLVRLPAGPARAFAQRATRVVGAGRPTCPFCGEPIDPGGHLCVRANGFKRREP